MPTGEHQAAAEQRPAQGRRRTHLDQRPPQVGQLLALGDDELLRMRNFGKKSLDEMKERLALRGFIVPESGAGSVDESDLPAAAELDEAVAAELDREG